MRTGMKLWIVEREEFSGYDCNGHWQKYIVAAETAEEANGLFEDEGPVRELVVPDLSKLRKPRRIG